MNAKLCAAFAKELRAHWRKNSVRFGALGELQAAVDRSCETVSHSVSPAVRRFMKRELSARKVFALLKPETKRQITDARKASKKRGVKKTTRKASRSSTRSTPVKSGGPINKLTLEAFARVVQDATRRTKPWAGGSSVFISHVWDRVQKDGYTGTLPQFKALLFQAHQNDLLELSRADLVDAMPTKDVVASEYDYRGARFHFIRADGFRIQETTARAGG